MTKSKTHTVEIKIRVDTAITARQARYAVWNAIHGFTRYGDKSAQEPFTNGKISVALSAPRKSAGGAS